VALLGQMGLDKITRNGELGAGHVGPQPGPRDRPERLAGGDPARHEVAPDDPLGHPRQRKLPQRPADVPAGVTTLQAAGQHGVQRDARHHAQLPGRRDGPRQPPIGHAHAHATLDQGGRDRRSPAISVPSMSCRPRRGQGLVRAGRIFAERVTAGGVGTGT
jgi:hypothetical protein